ncbi:MFS transporter, SP family, solute carrier family 2, member 1, partial [Paragonimus westermani]
KKSVNICPFLFTSVHSLQHIKAFLSETVLHVDMDTAEKQHLLVNPSFLYAQISTTFVVAAALGASGCGWLAESIGRRNALLLNNLFAVLGAGLCAPCVLTKKAALLFVGRFVLGINSGMTIGIASIYLTEIAPRDVRGAIGACHQLATTIGIVVAYLMTMTCTLNTEQLWPIAVVLGSIPAIISLIVLPFCPESPRFLFLKKGQELESRRGFLRLNSKENVETFIGELREEIEVAKNQPEFKFRQLFKQKDLRMPTLIACLIQVLQQLSGINAVITYSSSMLKTAGLPDEYNQFCVITIGACNVLMTMIALPLLERAGRRTLLLWPTVTVGIALLMLTVSVTLATHLTVTAPRAAQIMGIVSALLIFVYMCGFALGLGPVPALIVSEIFRQGPRAAAYSLSQSVQWLSNLLVLCSYPSINVSIC